MRQAERAEPRRQFTPLEEATELLAVGATATVLALALTLALGHVLNLIDVDALADGPGRYLVLHPAVALLALVSVLALSYGAVWTAAALIYRGRPKSIRPAATGLHQALSGDIPKDHGAWITAELRDGRAVSGALRWVPVDPTPRRELVLTAPVNGHMQVRGQVGTVTDLSDDFIVLNLDDVLYVSGRYLLEEVIES